MKRLNLSISGSYHLSITSEKMCGENSLNGTKFYSKIKREDLYLKGKKDYRRNILDTLILSKIRHPIFPLELKA